MKTRTGFVSNSSSSSFVIGFPKKPETVAEMKETLFPEGKSQSIQCYGSTYGADQVAETVFNDIKDQKPLTKKKILAAIREGEFEGMPRYPDSIFRLNGQAYHDAWAKYEADRLVAAQAFYEKKLATSKLKYFEVEYSDNDGDYGSTLEHGDTFSNITHIRVSHH